MLGWRDCLAKPNHFSKELAEGRIDARAHFAGQVCILGGHKVLMQGPPSLED